MGYVSRQTRLVPTPESRAFHKNRHQKYGVEKFETYNDWFYFIHVDPVIRAWHAFGMVVGSGFYIWAFLTFWNQGLDFKLLFQIPLGAFFFFFLPLLSHFYYDGGGARSTPDRFHSTFLPVVHINLMTLTGTYQGWLKKFIEKYPFVTEAWALESRDD